jgi:hypothetical protein
MIRIDSSGAQHVIWVATDQGIYYTRHDAVVGLPPEGKIPIEPFALEQNYPNPFNGTTIIRYFLPKTQKVSFKIFDLLGREIETREFGEQEASLHSVAFNARGLASGVYLYRLQGSNYSITRKMYLLR